MSQRPQYEKLASSHPEAIVLQHQGNFYNAFDASAIAVSTVLGYKLRKTGKGTYTCGIPETVLDERLATLKAAGLGYVVFDKGNIVKGEKPSNESAYAQLTEDFIDLPRKEEKVDKVSLADKYSDFMFESRAKEQPELPSNPSDNQIGKKQHCSVAPDICARLDQFCQDKKSFDREICLNWVIDEGLRKLGY